MARLLAGRHGDDGRHVVYLAGACRAGLFIEPLSHQCGWTALLLASSSSFELIVCGMLILGYASGAYLQLCTYLTSRYAGVRHFGKIFGVMASLMALGTGVGPVIAGAVCDHFGSYSPLLMSGIPVGLICGILVMQLGPYPQFRDGLNLQLSAQ